MRNGGFTLIEILISLAIMGLILSLGLLVNTNSLVNTFFQSEKTVILSSLQKARNRSMTNYHETAHGLCFDNADPGKPKYVLFQAPYSPNKKTNEYLEANKAVRISSVPDQFLCMDGGIIFSQLSGRSSAVTIDISEDQKKTEISINQSGRINW